LADINETTVLAAAQKLRLKYPTSEAVGVKCDVSVEADVKALIDVAVDKWGRLDVLVSSTVPCVASRLTVVQQRRYHASS
jgi:NAD(P)-dependent dehydrogenase (short-subunit alcohol dehydrogenase family)